MSALSSGGRNHIVMTFVMEWRWPEDLAAWRATPHTQRRKPSFARVL